MPMDRALMFSRKPLLAGSCQRLLVCPIELSSRLFLRRTNCQGSWVTPVFESRKMAEALKAEGADVRDVEFPGVGHNAWDHAYGDEALWEWLFQQRRVVR